MTTQDVLFIIICLLIIITLVLYSFVSSAIYKKEQALKSPYYFCDGDWECCKSADANCDVDLLKDFSEYGYSKATLNTYFPSDRWTPGSPYHQNCILPINNAIKNYNTSANHNFDFGWIYDGSLSIASNHPSVYYPGCSANGAAYTGTNAECTNPKLNPWHPIIPGSCDYTSIDGPRPDNIKYIYNPTFPDNDSNYDDLTKATLNKTAKSDFTSAKTSSFTFNPNKWNSSNPGSKAYIAGLQDCNLTGGCSANGYTCPWTSGANCGTNSKSTQNYNVNNTLAPSHYYYP